MAERAPGFENYIPVRMANSYAEFIRTIYRFYLERKNLQGIPSIPLNTLPTENHPL